MPRERFEREHDREAERETIASFAALLGCEFHKLRDSSNTYYSTLDFFIASPADFGVAWVEVKARTHAFGTYPTLMLSAGKFRDGAVWSLTTGVPFVVLVRFADGPYYYKYNQIDIVEHRISVEWGGRTARMRDSQDTEPVVHIPWQLFSPAVESERLHLDFPPQRHLP